jgi:hypothetical protein
VITLTKLSSKQVIDYYNRCYKVVDGLWFMKVEEKHGFEEALNVDNEVWKVMPKIQARMIKSFLGLETGPEALLEGVETKLELDGFKFTAQKNENCFRITITDCPWLNLMTKSGRDHLAEAVGETVCTTEYNAWVSELAPDMKFELKSKKCKNKQNCVLQFVKH